MDIKLLGDLRPDDRNARRHNPRNVGMIVEALQEVGAARSGVIDEDGRILAGNATWQALAEAGIERVKVVEADGNEWVVVKRSGLTEGQKRRLALFDNRSAELADWDAEVLAELMAEDEELLEGLWYEDELEKLLADIMKEEPAADPGPQLDHAAALREKWGTHVGQIWQLGEHRLAVGDCTDPAVVDALMRGERGGAVVTDPPYGIEREGILNDDPKELRSLYDGCLMAMPIDDAVIIAFQSPRLFWVWLDAVRDTGHRFERMLWLDKVNDETFPWRGWITKSEAILVSSIGKPRWIEVHPYVHDVYRITSIGQELPKEWGKVHASVKPLSVVQDLVSRVGGTVYDPFVGSGTTIVACQRLGRKCRAVELSPSYAAVCIQRLADMGLSPRLVD